MNFLASRHLLPLTVALTMMLTGCLTENDTYIVGIEGTGAPATSENTQGTVTAYGSVIVNGQRIELNTASILVNGKSASEDEIQLGMKVSIDAERDRSGSVTVRSVRYDRQLQGPVSEVVHAGATHKELDVLGQTLVVYDDVVFAGITFAELAEGVALDVSGFVDPEDRIMATRVARAAANAASEVSGEVQALNPGAATFRLRDLSIEYDQAILVGVSLDSLADGQKVSVRGAINEGRFVAERVTLRDQDPAPAVDGTRVSLEGVVGNYQSAANFRLNGVLVNAEDADVSGGGFAQLGSGVRVMVEGHMEEGWLNAESLWLLLPGVNRVVGTVEDIDPATGQLVVMGMSYVAGPLTAFEDHTPSPNRLIGMTEIRVGDRIEMFAHDQGERMLATRIKRLDGDPDVVSLRGPVTQVDIAGNQIAVKNVWVNLGDALGSGIIADLSRGDFVMVQGTRTDARIAADVLDILDVSGLPGCFPPVLDCAPPAELTSSRLDWEGLEPPTFRF
jgi:hypothetical protein